MLMESLLLGIARLQSPERDAKDSKLLDLLAPLFPVVSPLSTSVSKVNYHMRMLFFGVDAFPEARSTMRTGAFVAQPCAETF